MQNSSFISSLRFAQTLHLCACLFLAVSLVTVSLVKAEDDAATKATVTGDAALLKPAPSGMTSAITSSGAEYDRDAALKAAARDRVDTRGEFYEAPIRLYDIELNNRTRNELEGSEIKVTDSFGDEFKDSKRIDDGTGTGTKSDSPGESSRSPKVAKAR